MRCLTFLFLACLLYAPHGYAQASTTEPAQLFKKYGLRPLKSPVSAIPFTLSDLNGKSHSLSDYRGQWVLLNFWATWCGACAAQISDLRVLEENLQGKGLKVLAVAIDGTTNELRSYKKRKKINYTILHDKVGTIGANYKASSIPLNYIIDPEGRIVSLVRGAFKWKETIPLFAQLLNTPFDPASFKDTASTAPTTLNEIDPNMVPPVLDATPPLAEIVPDEPFTLDIQVTWSGKLQDYLIEPPEVNLPEGIEKISMQASASGQQGRQALTYKLSLKANKSGNYQLGPIELRYKPRIEQAPLSTRHPGFPIEVKEFLILGLPPIQFLLLILGCLATLYALYFFTQRRKQRQQAIQTHTESQAHTLGALLEEAERAKMEGNAAAFLEIVLRFLDVCGQPDALGYKKEELVTMLEKTRFAQEPPGSEVLASIGRHMQREVKQEGQKSTD